MMSRAESRSQQSAASSRGSVGLATLLCTSLGNGRNCATRPDLLSEQPAGTDPGLQQQHCLPSYLRIMYSELRAEQRGNTLMQLQDPVSWLQLYQTFLTGISATVTSLDDPLVGNRRLHYLAEVQAAILAQRRLSRNFSGSFSLHSHMRMREVLDSQQLARIQLPKYDAPVIPDLSLLARLILDSLEPNLTMHQLTPPGLDTDNREQAALLQGDEVQAEPEQAGSGSLTQRCVQEALEVQAIICLLEPHHHAWSILA
ncbi:hypothetical protein WJX73_003487 [Symbiochloris irregularis]|uniref:Uncharacterized protein n=1 Tax=Symbiochloris irregularis TaxID=706552 RepID=A0AAW1P224_9CHLO